MPLLSLNDAKYLLHLDLIFSSIFSKVHHFSTARTGIHISCTIWNLDYRDGNRLYHWKRINHLIQFRMPPIIIDGNDSMVENVDSIIWLSKHEIYLLVNFIIFAITVQHKTHSFFLGFATLFGKWDLFFRWLVNRVVMRDKRWLTKGRPAEFSWCTAGLL